MKILKFIVGLILFTGTAYATNDRVQSSTANPMPFLMVLSSDHVTAATGLSPTVTISKNGGSFASPSGAVTELANGWYLLAGNATDRNTLGDFIIHATGTGADPADSKFTITAFDPFDSVRMGLTALPNAAAEAAGGLYTRGTGAGQINQSANGMIDTNSVRLLNTAYSTPATAGIMDVNIKNINNVVAATPGASGGILISGSNSGTTTLGALTITGVMSINGTGNVAQTGDSYTRIGSAGAGLTAVFANNTVDSTGGGLNAGLALKYLMSAVFNTAPQTAGTNDVLALKAFDGTTGLATQTIAGAGTGRTTTIP